MNQGMEREKSQSQEYRQTAQAARAVDLDEIVARHRLGLGVVLAERADERRPEHRRSHAAEAVQRPVNKTAEQICQQPTAQGGERDVLEFRF